MRSWFWSMTLVVGCSSAEEPSLESSRTGMHAPVVACWAGDDTCGAHGYCDVTRCDRPGTCRRRPASTSEYEPVCGCADGVTYWSASWAAHQGVSAVGGACDKASNTGLRPDPVSCRGDDDCAVSGARCVTIGCNVPEATCWSLPETVTCDASTYRPWRTCDGARRALTECEAVQTGAPYGM